MNTTTWRSLRADIDAVRHGRTDAQMLLVSAIERARHTNAELNAVRATFDASTRSVPPARSVGPLCGMPVAVKDTFALPWHAPRDGTPTTAGGPGAGASAVFRRLHAAGARVAMATTMHQLGMGTTGHVCADGPCRNPWNAQRCAGGSSGGSAAVVAAGAVALAIGTDAGGSIRIPASYCGVTGLKPTWGAVPADGCTAAYSSMMSIGPITRDVADCRLAAEVLLGRALPASTMPLRFGLLQGPFVSDLAPDVASAYERVREALPEAATTRDVRLRGSEHIAVATIAAMGYDRLPQMTRRWMQSVFPTLDPTVRGVLRARQDMPATVAAQTTRLRTLLRRELARAFKSVDILVCPTVPGTAPPLDHPRLTLPSGQHPADLAAVRMTGLANLTGIPAISLPCGHDRNGLPIGVMLHAAWGREAQLLDGADCVERLMRRYLVTGSDGRVAATRTEPAQ
jgi:aspartyl-tRNA(Asn)/glutamyl-tRNA(Gln) amidotransferase subunit A